MRSMWNRYAMDDVLEKWALLQVSFASCRSWSLKLVTSWIIESLTLPSLLALITLYMWSHGLSINRRSSTSSSSLRSLGFERFHSILVPCWRNFWVSHGQGFTSNSGDDPTTSYWGSVQGVRQWGCFFGTCDWREVEACIEALLNLGCFQLPAFRL